MDKYFGAKIAPTPVRDYAFDICCAAQDVEFPKQTRPAMQKLLDKCAMKSEENGLNLDDNMLTVRILFL